MAIQRYTAAYGAYDRFEGYDRHHPEEDDNGEYVRVKDIVQELKAALFHVRENPNDPEFHYLSIAAVEELIEELEGK